MNKIRNMSACIGEDEFWKRHNEKNKGIFKYLEKSLPPFIFQYKMRTGPTNPILQKIILELKKSAREQNTPLWKRIAKDLEKSTRQRKIVNLSKLNRHTKENEVVIVPGKVLGSGVINHRLTISAFQFSDSAKRKLEQVGSTIVSLLDISKESPKGKRIRIIG